MTVITADARSCMGHGNCVAAAPDYFDLDDAGTVTLLRTEVDDADLARVTLAVNSCPVAVLRLEPR
jgi:ferredoxin